MCRSIKILLSLLLIFTVIAFAGEIFYHSSSAGKLSVGEFKQQLENKQQRAEKILAALQKRLSAENVDSLHYFRFPADDISFYVSEGDNLLFWSDNHVDLQEVYKNDYVNWTFAELGNVSALLKSVKLDSLNITALITIKYNFCYENQKLSNTFADGFTLNSEIGVAAGNADDKFVIAEDGNYLFSLVNAEIYTESGALNIVIFIIETLAFLLLLLFYINFYKFLKISILTLKTFLISTLVLSVLVAVLLYFGFPHFGGQTQFFSAFEYASTPFLASLMHLTIITFYLFAVIYVFYFKVEKISVKKTPWKYLLQLLFVLFFVLFYNVLQGVVLHSTFRLSILQFNHLNFMKIWVHLLFFIWGICLVLFFYKTHNRQSNYSVSIIYVVLALVVSFVVGGEYSWFFTVSLLFFLTVLYAPFIVRKKLNYYSYSIALVLVFTSILIVNSSIFHRNKMREIYRFIAENVAVSGTLGNDITTEIMFEELDNQLNTDWKLHCRNLSPDSLVSVSDYLNQNYFRGFWNSFEVKINLNYVSSETDSLENDTVLKIRNTHFCFIPTSYSSIYYEGKFMLPSVNSDSLILSLEFYPNKNFHSYSFPDLLIDTDDDLYSRLRIAVAKYRNGKLEYFSGNASFPVHQNWKTAENADYFHIKENEKHFYVYCIDEAQQIVLSRENPYELTSYIVYFAYCLVIFLFLAYIMIWFYLHFINKKSWQMGFTMRFQYIFVGLLIISFLGIFYVSVDFIKQFNQKEQISQLEHKKNYIRSRLQEMYYWVDNLSAVNTQRMNFDLQELSYMYKTDIFVYDNEGFLVGSSQPLIFSKRLISNKISPDVLLEKNSNINREENIGSLQYLTGYTDFFNGDYLQIGYIAVPQFLSSTETRTVIESFLSVIIHIYLIIIVLTILLVLFLGKRLSLPLRQIETKLKQMKFGHRNEKIDYQSFDEIGQLVAQYNRTIDELEKSAELLAQSERESAWKTMARQIAHEINNPLTPMKLTIQQLQRLRKNGDERFDAMFDKSADTLVEQIDNLSHIAGTFSNFAKMPAPRFEKVDVAAKLYSVTQLFISSQEETEIHYSGVTAGIFTQADAEQLTQVFNNLLKNAVQSIPTDRRGKIDVSISKVDKYVKISIKDNGCGISDEIVDKLFVPNFTTKSSGMGLGLSITKNIIEQMKGKINFISRVGEGSEFFVELPVY
ncbi:MAG: HAMP domain-containing histidine kinase [Paludibacter sp.]|jgi:signal transduction histidine kinase|nr:HAMP domain-containing histidine kinase [Paludibacter sp.]